MNAITQAAADFAEQNRRRTRIATEATILMRSELGALREQAAKVPAMRVTINDLHCENRGLRLELAGKDRVIRSERAKMGVIIVVWMLAFAWMAV